MWRDAVCVASSSCNMVLRRAEQHQFYMELTPLLIYLGAMVLRQAKCNSICSAETISLVKSFLDQLSKTESDDSKLYTPSQSDYRRLQGVVFSLQQNCSRSTLLCYEKEMTVLVQEQNLSLQKLEYYLPSRLSKLRRHVDDTIQSCPQCEVYKEEKAEKFLSTLLNILQIMCSSNNTTPR